MRHFILTIAFCLFAVSAYTQTDSIYYKTRNKITWDDFKGTARDTTEQVNAFLSTTIQMQTLKVNVWTGIATFDANGVVFLNRSWAKANKKTDDELRYQQVFFDISELVARKLRKEINGLKINAGNRKKIAETFQAYNKMVNDTHTQYATETRQGVDHAKQHEWEARINDELKKLN